MTGYGYPQMERLLPPSMHGRARIMHQTLTRMQALVSAVKAGHTHYDESGGTVVSLHVEGEDGTMMADNGFERRTSLPAVRQARGDVLIAGLGLGMILHPICGRGRVRSVTVLEKYPDVLELVRPSLPRTRKLRIEIADAFTWEPGARAFDTIWFDIWPHFGAGTLVDMVKLHSRYKPHLRPGGWMDSWMRPHNLRVLEEHRSPGCDGGRAARALREYFHDLCHLDTTKETP